MPTREEEAARWRAISLDSRKSVWTAANQFGQPQISLDSRKAAQRLLEVGCYRSSVSRAYYAAYSAITSALIRQGITLAHEGNNPSHISLPVLVLNNLTFLPLKARFDLNRGLRRLYSERVEADYNAAATVNGGIVIEALRDMNRILTLLDIEETE